jgi:hypothetical protein
MPNLIIQKPGGMLETIGRDGLDRIDGRGLLKCTAWAGAGVLQDGLDRVDGRGLLKCMACSGAGVLWTVSGGAPRSPGIGDAYAAMAGARSTC